MLGPLSVVDGGKRLDLGGPRQRDVLAVLLAAAPDDVSVDRLVDEVWGDHPPTTATHVVRTYISNLRAILGDRIISDGHRYRLDLDGDACDAAGLTRALAAARTLTDVDPQGAYDELSEAVAQWRGRPFEDVGVASNVIRTASQGLEERYLQARELRIVAALRMGRHEEVIPELMALVDDYPFREHVTAQLMVAMYRSGRQADALGVFRDLKTRLAEELGLDPSPELRRLEEQVLRQDAALELGPPHNIPTPVSTFIGRLVEIGEVAQRVEASRLVTLVGPGGVGKTRLAREVAVRLLAGFRDGVFWIDVAPLRDSEAVTRQIADILGLVGQPGLALADVARRFLSDREVLLVFDNCEHLGEAVGKAATSLLESGPKVKVLATARRQLGVVGEVRVDVPAMGLPDLSDPGSPMGTSDAEQLFMSRARGSSGEAVVTADDVAQLCLRLDGLPLAIEMAAARTGALTVAEVLRRLEHGTGFLVATEVDRDERQRTLDATIWWSYDLLDTAAQSVFQRISVFRGAFDLDAARFVAGFAAVAPETVQRAIDDLVDASMLTTVSGDRTMRYRMQMTVQDHASRRLVESGDQLEVERRHCSHYLTLAAAAGPLRMTAAFAPAMLELERFDDDLNAALDWALVHQPELATEAAGGLVEYWSRRGDAAQAYRYGQAMLERGSEWSPATRADALLCASFGAALSGDLEFATTGPIEALSVADDGAGWQTRLWARHARGQIATVLGDVETVRTMGRSILEVCDAERLESPRAYGWSLLGLAEFFADGDYGEAIRCLDRAIEGMRALGDFGGMKAYGLVTAGTAAAMLGDYDAAQRYAAESLSIPGATPYTAMTYITLGGYTLHPMGELDRAALMLERGTRLAYDTSTEIWVRTGFLFLARVAADRQNWELAARLFGACRPNLPAWGRQARWWAAAKEVEQALGSSAFERLRDAGERADLRHVMAWIQPVRADHQPVDVRQSGAQ